MDDDSMDDSRMNEENVKRRQEQLLTNQEVQNVKSVLLKIQQAHISNVDLDRFVQEGYHEAVFNDFVRLRGNSKACAPTEGADPDSFDEQLKKDMLRLGMHIHTVSACLSDELSLAELVDGLINKTIPHPVTGEQQAFNLIRAGSILAKHYAIVKRNDDMTIPGYLELGKQLGKELGLGIGFNPKTVTKLHDAGEIRNARGLEKVSRKLPIIYSMVGGSVKETARLGSKIRLKTVDQFLTYVADFPVDVPVDNFPEDGDWNHTLEEYYTGIMTLQVMRILESSGSIKKAEAALLTELEERSVQLLTEAAAAEAAAAAGAATEAVAAEAAAGTEAAAAVGGEEKEEEEEQPPRDPLEPRESAVRAAEALRQHQQQEEAQEAADAVEAAEAAEQQEAAEAAGLQDAMDESAADVPPPLVLSGNEFGEATKTVTATAADESPCVICTADLDGAVCQLHACKHRFHFQCISPWLIKSSRACPLCKTDAMEFDADAVEAEAQAEAQERQEREAQYLQWQQQQQQQQQQATAADQKEEQAQAQGQAGDEAPECDQVQVEVEAKEDGGMEGEKPPEELESQEVREQRRQSVWEPEWQTLEDAMDPAAFAAIMRNLRKAESAIAEAEDALDYDELALSQLLQVAEDAVKKAVEAIVQEVSALQAELNVTLVEYPSCTITSRRDNLVESLRLLEEKVTECIARQEEESEEEEEEEEEEEDEDGLLQQGLPVTHRPEIGTKRARDEQAVSEGEGKQEEEAADALTDVSTPISAETVAAQEEYEEAHNPLLNPFGDDSSEEEEEEQEEEGEAMDEGKQEEEGEAMGEGKQDKEGEAMDEGKQEEEEAMAVAGDAVVGVGSVVQIVGLQSRPELNNTTGRVLMLIESPVVGIGAQWRVELEDSWTAPRSMGGAGGYMWPSRRIQGGIIDINHANVRVSSEGNQEEEGGSEGLGE
jgi:hypothetical protein